MYNLKNHCDLVEKKNIVFLIDKARDLELPITYVEAYMIMLINNENNQEKIKALFEKFCDCNSCTHNFFDVYEDVMEKYGQFFQLKKDKICKKVFVNFDDIYRIEYIPNDLYCLPRTALFHITDACDKNCIYCYFDNKIKKIEEDLLSSEEVFDIIDKLYQVGVYSITFTGGEPFLRKDIFEIINYASSKKIHSIITTKHFFYDKELLNIKSKKYVHIDLSFDTDKKEFEYKYYKSRNHIKKMYRNIELFKKIGIDFKVSICITAETLDSIFSFLNNLFLSGVYQINLVRCRFDDEDKIDKSKHDLMINIDKWSEFISELDRLDPKIKKIISYDPVNSSSDKIKKNSICQDLYEGCVNGKTCISIMPNGNAVICEHARYSKKNVLGDLIKNDIRYVWKNENLEIVKKVDTQSINYEICSKCIAKKICNKKNKCYLKYLI